MSIIDKHALPAPFGGWFAARGWRPFPHQLAMLEADRAGQSAKRNHSGMPAFRSILTSIA